MELANFIDVNETYGLMEDKVNVKIDLINWDRECEIDMVSGKGFPILQEPYDKKDKKKKNPYGIMSEKFSTDWEDKDAFEERYSCKCKSLKGRAFEGELCPICNTRVEFINVDYKMTGWINLGQYKIIQPAFYDIIQTVIGKAELEVILKSEIDIDINGNKIDEVDKITMSSYNNKKPVKETPFNYIGVQEFRRRFTEIMHYYLKKKKNKASTIFFLLEKKDDIFASNIPVFTSILRPETISQEDYYYYNINTIYKTIFKLTKILHNEEINSNAKAVQLDIEKALYKIQTRTVDLNQKIFALLDGKTGFIKQHIIGGRLSWSSRCVIIPDPTLLADEIKLPYLAFMEMYKFELIGYIKDINKVTLSQAFHIWNMACLRFDPKVYEIIKYMLEKDNPMCIVNRNPTINYGSADVMRIVEVPADYCNLCMSLPIASLVPFNADFDGDVLNIYSLKSNKLKTELDRFYNPKKNFYISRTDGLFNRDVDLLKDQSIGLYDFNTI